MLGRVIGPVEVGELPAVHINRFGVIPKPHQPGKWRLIVDLSHPEGRRIVLAGRTEDCLMTVRPG